MLFKQRSHVRKIAVEPENPSIADRFAEVMVRLHLEHDLGPDVLAAAGRRPAGIPSQGKETNWQRSRS
jgi:hypothetical protein